VVLGAEVVVVVVAEVLQLLEGHQLEEVVEVVVEVPQLLEAEEG
jgi:hypothetical protein